MMEKRVPDWQFGDGCWKRAKAKDIFEEVSDKNHPDMDVLTIRQGFGTVFRNESGIDISFRDESKAAYKKVEKGNFIIHLRSFQGGLEMANYDGIVSPAYTVLRNKLPINGRFFNAYFHTHKFIHHELAKAVEGIRDGRQISYHQFTVVHIPCPSLREQKKIADYLTYIDNAIIAQETKLDNMRAMKRGAMQKIFLRGWRFRDEDGRKFPEWEEKRLGEVSYLRGRIGFRGYSHKDIVSKDEGIISLSPTNIVDNFISFEDGTYITYEKYKESPEIQIKINDILFTKTGSTLGKVGFVNELRQPATINPQIALITAKYNPKYLFYFLRSEASQRYIREIGVGGAIPTLSQEILKRMRIPFPCFAEQQKIADYFQRLDKIIETESAALDAMRKIKRGLLQRLFV